MAVVVADVLVSDIAAPDSVVVEDVVIIAVDEKNKMIQLSY
jgi:hypothetical protein